MKRRGWVSGLVGSIVALWAGKPTRAEAAVSVTFGNVITTAAGTIFINLSDGSQLEFGSLDQLRNIVAAIDDPIEGRFLATMMGVAWWIARDPDASNSNLISGKTVTLNLSAPNSFRVQ